MIYRAYRGFFIIIPAVFKEVQGRLTAGLVEAESELNADLDPSTGKLRTRSAILISIGASAVTLIYTLKTISTGFVKGTKSILNFLRGGKHSLKTSQNTEVKVGLSRTNNLLSLLSLLNVITILATDF